MPDPGHQRVEGYNTDQDFLGRIEAAVARTRLSAEQEPRLQFHEDGSYTWTVAGRLMTSLDTIGTKADLHWKARTFGAAAQDAFAMNVNDLYRDRFEPLLLENLILIEGEDGEAIAGLAEGLSELSVERGIQMGAGETAILDTVPGFELGAVVTGPKLDEAENRFRPGDVLVGIPSSGIHSNGLTDARRLFAGHHLSELRVPTRIYDEVPELLKAGVEVHGLGHITGGGLSKLRTDGLDFHVTQTHLNGAADVFYELYDRWLKEVGGEFSSGTDSAWVDDRMHRKFNSGIGFVLGCAEESVKSISKAVPDAQVVGYVRGGDGRVIIERSEYTHRPLILGTQEAG